MTKSQLIAALANKQLHLSHNDADEAVNSIIQSLTGALAAGIHVEIRGFGTFSTIPREARIGRNPKTGESVSIPTRHVIHFKPGLDMRERVDQSRLKHPILRV
ncbi:integration host factor subunit beta [Methylomonas sp. AM2-LC]|uniref:integration host factor subunit beta n=1 Tax=Methylomonas sp. AM2-LC TaxID=3153301 RepID=UPI003266F2EB